MSSDARSGSRVGNWLIAWAVVFAASFVIPRFVPPSGEGFMRGLNRIVWWFWLQAGAAGIAVTAAVLARRDRAISPRVRLASQIVLGITVLVVALVAMFLFGAAY